MYYRRVTGRNESNVDRIGPIISIVETEGNSVDAVGILFAPILALSSEIEAMVMWHTAIVNFVKDEEVGSSSNGQGYCPPGLVDESRTHGPTSG